ncbi:hypothetical protein GY26_17555, partial [Gammaproteobacteria bacterium MFB021]
MAALLTVVRVDGNVFVLDPRKLLIPGMALTEGATLVAPDGGRLILADGAVLPLNAGQPLILQVVEDVPTLLVADAGSADSDIAALQAAIEAGVDPTAVQQAPAAGNAGGGGGSLSGEGGFSNPFDIARVGREESSSYSYNAAFADPGAPVVTPASFSPPAADAPADAGGVATPSVTIRLDAIASDDILNLAESEQPVALSGSAGGDAAAGDVVTVTIGGVAYSTTLTDQLTFSVTVPGSLLATNPAVTATVTHAANGTTVTATTTRPYEVDTDTPSPTVRLDTIAGDDVVNAVESRGDLTLSGSVGGDAAAGDRVTVIIGDQQYTAIVQNDLSFSVAVPGSVLAGSDLGAVIAVVSHTDAAGNTGSATTSRDYGVDTTSPQLGISLDSVAGDGIVNAGEAGQTLPITGQVTGEYSAGDTVTLTVGDQTYTGTVDGDGRFSISVPGSQLAGNDTIEASVTHTDAAGNTGSASTDRGYGVDTTAPAAVADTGTTSEGQTLAVGAARGVLANDSDVGSDGAALRVVAINGSSNAVGQAVVGSGGGTFVVQADGSYRFLPGDTFNSLGAGDSATSQISYTVSDSHGNLSVTTLTITIDGLNDSAIISGNALGSVTEDSNVTNGNLTTAGTLTVVDPDAGQSSFNPDSVVFTGATGVIQGNGGALGVLSIAANGAWSYTVDNSKVQYLDAGQSRVETYTVTSADGSATQTITVTIHGAADAPTIGGATSGAVTEDVAVTNGNLVTSGTLTIVDADTGQSSFRPGAATPIGNPLGSLTIGANGQWNYTVDNSKVQYLAAGQSKVEQFTVTTADGTPQTIRITITGTNEVPVARADTGSIGENGTLNVTAAQGVLANDSDVDGGTLSVSAVNGVAGSVGQAIAGSNGGTFTLNADGSYSFNPGKAFDRLAAGQQDTTQISYTVSDGQGGTATSTLTVTVTGTNDAPVAVADTQTTGENATLNAQVPAATDVDGTVESYQLATGVGQGNGSLSFNSDGSYTFNPGADFDALAAGQSRDVTFTYTATDNNGGVSAPQTVTITVTGTNDVPVAKADTQITGENATLTSQVPAATDVDGTVESYQLATGVGQGNGALSFNSDGSYTFNPGADFDGL